MIKQLKRKSKKFVTVWGYLIKKNKHLIAPKHYWQSIALKAPNYINGCGAGITTSLVPDTLLGLSIYKACNIHDYMYKQGINKKQADDIFLKNMISIINKESDSLVLKSLRKAKAYIYYFAVKLFGSSYFRASSN